MGSLALSWALAAASLRGQMVHRANFAIVVASGLVYQGTGFVFIWVVIGRFEALAGWSLGEVAFLYGLRLTAHGLYTVTFNGLRRIGHSVRRGELDRALVRPLPALPQLLFERLQVSGLGDLLGGVVLFGAANALVGVDWSLPALGYLALVVVGGCLLEAGLQLTIAALSFRYLEMGALSHLVDTLIANFGNYPMRVYGAAAQVALTFVVPVAFIAYFPAAVLLGRTGELGVPPALAYGAPLVGAVLFALAHRFWKREMRHYQSAGH